MRGVTLWFERGRVSSMRSRGRVEGRGGVGVGVGDRSPLGSLSSFRWGGWQKRTWIRWGLGVMRFRGRYRATQVPLMVPPRLRFVWS